jgi:hypothetical protein
MPLTASLHVLGRPADSNTAQHLWMVGWMGPPVGSPILTEFIRYLPYGRIYC